MLVSYCESEWISGIFQAFSSYSIDIQSRLSNLMNLCQPSWITVIHLKAYHVNLFIKWLSKWYRSQNRGNLPMKGCRDFSRTDAKSLGHNHVTLNRDEIMPSIKSCHEGESRSVITWSQACFISDTVYSLRSDKILSSSFEMTVFDLFHCFAKTIKNQTNQNVAQEMYKEKREMNRKQRKLELEKANIAKEE